MDIPRYANRLVKLHWFLAVQLASFSIEEWLELRVQLQSAVKANLERHEAENET